MQLFTQSADHNLFKFKSFSDLKRILKLKSILIHLISSYFPNNLDIVENRTFN